MASTQTTPMKDQNMNGKKPTARKQKRNASLFQRFGQWWQRRRGARAAQDVEGIFIPVVRDGEALLDNLKTLGERSRVVVDAVGGVMAWAGEMKDNLTEKRNQRTFQQVMDDALEGLKLLEDFATLGLEYLDGLKNLSDAEFEWAIRRFARRFWDKVAALKQEFYKVARRSLGGTPRDCDFFPPYLPHETVDELRRSLVLLQTGIEAGRLKLKEAKTNPQVADIFDYLVDSVDYFACGCEHLIPSQVVEE